MFKGLREKLENHFVSKAVKKVEEIIKEDREKTFWSSLHRQLRRERWLTAETVANLSRNEAKFKRLIEEAMTLNTSRGYEGYPVAMSVSLSGLFFRFIKGNAEAVEAIGQAVAAMARMEFEKVVA